MSSKKVSAKKETPCGAVLYENSGVGSASSLLPTAGFSQCSDTPSSSISNVSWAGQNEEAETLILFQSTPPNLGPHRSDYELAKGDMHGKLSQSRDELRTTS